MSPEMLSAVTFQLTCTTNRRGGDTTSISFSPSPKVTSRYHLASPSHSSSEGAFASKLANTRPWRSSTLGFRNPNFDLSQAPYISDSTGAATRDPVESKTHP